MKMKKSQFLRIVAIALVLCMTAAWLPVGALAASLKKDKKVVVSLGDSMTNGYGNAGYDNGSGIVDYANSSFANQFAAWIAGYTGEITNDQVVFKGDNAVVDHRQLAMSGMRAVDLYWLLTLDYKDVELINQLSQFQWDAETWNSTFDSGDYQTYAELLDPNLTRRLYTGADKILSTYGKDGTGYGYYTPTYKESFLQITAEFYQKSVKDADVILMSMGNSDFGSFMLWGIVNYIMEGTKFSDSFDVANIYEQMPSYMKDLVQSKLGEFNIGGMLGGIAGDNPDAADEIGKIVEYCVVNYIFNYMRLLDVILEMNPDVQIIQVGSVNTYASEDGNDQGAIGEVTNVLFENIDSIVQLLPKILIVAGMNAGWRANFQYVDIGYVESLINVYGDDFYMDENGAFVKYPGSLKGDEGYTANPNSVVRQRLFEDIFNGQTFEILESAGMVSAEALSSVTLADVVEYELKTPADKVAYIAENADKATAIALYLAMEKAHIEGGKGKIMMSALGALGNLGTGLFDGAVNTLNNEAPEKGKQYLEYVAAVISEGTKDDEGNALLSADEVKLLLENEGSNDVIYQLIAGKSDGLITDDNGDGTIKISQLKEICESADRAKAINDFVSALVKAGMEQEEDIKEIMQQCGHNSVDEILNCTDEAHGDACSQAQNAYAENVDKYKPDVETAVGGFDSIKENYPSLKEAADSLCLLLVMPEVFGDAMVADETLQGVLAMNARCMIGTGVGSHPSDSGHNVMFAALQEVYKPAQPKDWFTNLFIMFFEWLAGLICQAVVKSL